MHLTRFWNNLNLVQSKVYNTNQMINQKYHTVGTIPKYHTVGTIPKYHTVGTIPKYHTVGTIPKSNIKMVERGKIYPPTHKYMTALFPLKQSIQDSKMCLRSPIPEGGKS